VAPEAVLNAVVKRKIPSLRRESNPRTPIIQPVATVKVVKKKAKVKLSLFLTKHHAMKTYPLLTKLSITP
jgi:hypothetical protein